MGTGQMLLTVLAVMLLGTTILSVNRNNLNQGTILRQTELGVYAVSLATSYIQRARSMEFDVKTTPGLPITLPQLTPLAGSLSTVMGPENPRLITPPGMEPIETANFDNTYDDFDDYNGFVKDTIIRDVDKFRVSAVVYYIRYSAPFDRVNGPTWLKQIDIKVNNTVTRNAFEREATNKGTDTIKLSYIMSFYK